MARCIEVQYVGIGEHGRIPVGGTADEEHRLPFGDGAARQVEVLARAAQHQLYGGVVAQELLDRGGHQIRPTAELVGGPRVAEQDECGVADEVGGRLVAGDQEQGAVGEEFVEVLVAVLGLCGHQCAQGVGRRRRVVAGEVLPEVGEHLRHAPRDGFGDRLGSGGEGGAVLLRNVEEVADDGERQGAGEVRDDVHPSGRPDVGDDPVDGFDDPGAELLRWAGRAQGLPRAFISRTHAEKSGDGGLRDRSRNRRLRYASTREGNVATINDAMSLEVVDIRGTAAVLRIEPAG